jgi:ferredoxin--NADP+ reductase
MMRAICNLTKEFNIKTMISMNPIMIDGTGMCGCCRLTVDGKTKFACVDGPDFDGHLVDFDEAIKRSRTYFDIEREAAREYGCRLMEGAKNA